ncbi:hypothetical protein [Paenibacillus periandrae]|uniref:hypothetical protein n=1 Tax=Paenibacillus periandrae TaxID=1761741 RepID=UPI001F09EE63|nr:hypothetical protein [Paenibacillus periandrae]
MRKVCIYTRRTETDGAHFLEREHVLSAGLGGINCLEKGVVCDEINSKFSKWETQFLRYSPISLPRQIHGPGKRGSLNLKDATKSVVNVFTPIDVNGVEDLDDIGLCYVRLGTPYTIPTLRIFKERLTIVCADEEKESFISRLKSCKETGFMTVPYDEMPFGLALLGFHDGKWHLACSPELEHKKVIDVIQTIKNGTINVLSVNEKESYYNSHQQLTFNEDIYSRVIAKFAFNFLAYSIGQDEVLDARFDPIREWIISDLSSPSPIHPFVVDNKYETEVPAMNLAHSISIIKDNEKNIFGIVSLYGGAFSYAVLLSSGYKGDFSVKILVCDWKEKKEFAF